MRGSQTRAFLLGAVLILLLLSGGCFLFAPPEPPTDVSASDGEYLDHVLVTWSSARRASRYEVFRATEEDGDYEKIGETPATRFSDTEASANVLYWYRVRACNQFGCSAFSQADSGWRLGQMAPSVPRNVQASDGTFSDRIRVTWSASPGASSYEIWRSDVRDADYFKIDTATSPPYEDRGVIRGRTYWYKITACNSYGCSDFSAPDSGVAALQVPAAPQNVRASDGIYSDRVRVAWNAVSGAAGYEVHRATSQGGTYELIGDTNGTTYDDGTVAVGTTYWYKVRAWNALGYGPFSDPDSGYASTAGGGGGGGGGGGSVLPGQPWNLAATDGTYDDKIVISWATAYGAKRYEVWRTPATSSGEPDDTRWALLGETTSTSYTDTGPGLCEFYWYKVRAWNDYGFGPFSVADSGHKGGKLGTVDTSKTEVKLLPLPGGYAVHLEWPNVKKAKEYDVVYEIWRRGPAGYATKIAKVVPQIGSDGKAVDPVVYQDSTLNEGGTYYYKIRVCSQAYADLLLPGNPATPCPTCGDCIACGGFSSEVMAVVTCNPLPPELETVTYNSRTQSATLIWTNPYTGTTAEDVVEFQVWRSTSADSGYTCIATSLSGTTYTDPDPLQGLQSGKTYTIYYRLKSCFACGCGVFSNTKSVTVKVP